MKILVLDSVDSTNKYAKEHIEVLADKTIITANKQTDGRGRLNRNWTDVGADNIYASIILKPSGQYKDVYSNLTQYLALVIDKTIEENYNVKPGIKWPNDILVNNKKIAGILAEGVLEKGMLKGLVLGFGINLNCNADAFLSINQPATALNIEAGMYIDKNIFIKKLSDNFFLSYDNFIQEGFSCISDEYKQKFFCLNKHVSVQVFDRKINGIAKDITENGSLMIVDENNKEQILYVGDIL